MSPDRSTLSFTLRLAPVTSEGKPVSSCRAIFSSLSDTPIGHTGPKYRAVQPTSCLAFGDALAARTKGTLSYSNLGDGHKSIIFCNLPHPLHISAGKPAAKQICFVAPNDGNGSITTAALITDLWCDNQHHIIIGRTKAGVVTRIRIRHTASADAQVREANRILDMLLPALTREEVTLTALLMRPLTTPLTLADNTELSTYYNLVYPKPILPSADQLPPTGKPRDEFMSRYERQLSRINTIHQSMLASFLADREAHRFPTPCALGALNSATDFIQHQRTIRSTTDRFESNLDGTGRDLSVHAQAMALTHFLGQ